jgi:biopolymer transport protein TolQ
MRAFRLIAVAFAVLTLSFAAPALAQRAPAAAPAGSGVSESHDLDAPAAAPTTNVDVTPGGTDIEPGATRLSVISVFLRADPVVKAVMVILLIASLWSWTIIINKWLAFGTLKRRAAKFEKVFWSGQSLDELYQQFAAKTDHPMAATFVAALREWRRAFESGGAPRESALAGIKERIEKAMGVTILRETDGLENQLGFLATVGSTAPFVGLFGTVWGIMNSFTAIAAQHNTTLAVVAPGIAEALFATAMGLLAAIPAVIFYNRFVNEIARYTTRLDAFADEFSAILSRQLDEKAR